MTGIIVIVKELQNSAISAVMNIALFEIGLLFLTGSPCVVSSGPDSDWSYQTWPPKENLYRN